MIHKIPSTDLEGFIIPEANGIDTIHVFWHDISLGRGMVLITCWGSSWSAYFGAMANDKIKDFFASADTPYLVGKMQTEHLKSRKKDRDYLAKLVNRIKFYIQEMD